MEIAKVKFEKEELELLTHPEFFLLKKRLGVKINDLLTQCIPVIKAELERNSSGLPQNLIDSTPKISKGENYLSFPWQILDFPRSFGKEETFALRTLCWYGNGISLSLLLGGEIANKYAASIHQNFSVLAENDFRICIHHDPFLHHFEEDNIISCKQFMESGMTAIDLLKNHQFIKIVKVFSFEEINSIPEKVGDSTKILLEMISGNKVV
jgi:hypothetical protein